MRECTERHVVPATCHPSESWDPRMSWRPAWIPAFAGMTRGGSGFPRPLHRLDLAQVRLRQRLVQARRIHLLPHGRHHDPVAEEDGHVGMAAVLAEFLVHRAPALL